MIRIRTAALVAVLSTTALTPLWAQDTTSDAEVEATAAEASETDAAVSEDGLLSEDALDQLMAPIALYPDTLLIQVLVASTYPLDVIKGERFLASTELEGEELKTAINSEPWDASVGVLATAFPDVLTKMADHVDWTETVGEAMMAQTDDVQLSIQRLRDQAVQTGALISTDQHIVEEVDEAVVITPADPEVVYVPEYDPEVVYVESDSGVSDALVTGGILFGTAILMNEIFDDDDDWDDYWGCRNCGGWGGGPVIRDPDIDIDIDGDVNIGNGNGNDIGWKPDDDRKDKAKDNLNKKKDKAGDIDRPSTGAPSRGDDLRKELSKDAGVKDISKDRGASAKEIRSEVGKTGNRPAAKDIKSNAADKNIQRPAKAAQKPAVKKPAAKKPAASRPKATKQQAFKPSGGGHSAAKKAKSRGAKSAAKSRGKRR
ncbi:MAG: DUF3300 domain-containing protein [Pseudoruegeria sp.]